MKINVSTVDGAVRIFVGFSLFVLAACRVIGPWAYIGLWPLVTGLFGYCPAYALFGFSTYRMEKR